MEYDVEVRCIKQYLALKVSLHWKPNQYNVYLHARSVDDPQKEGGKLLSILYHPNTDSNSRGQE